MSKLKTACITMSSAVISLSVAYFNYTMLENFSGIVRLMAIVLSALATGMGLGFFVQAEGQRSVGLGAFLGLLILWSPVVVVTYGFALMAVPLLAGFALLVFFGAKMGTRLRCQAQ